MNDPHKLPWLLIGMALLAGAVAFIIARTWKLELNGPPIVVSIMPAVVLGILARRSKPDDAISERDTTLTEQVREIAERLGTRPLDVYRYGSPDGRSRVDVSVWGARIYVSQKAYETLTEDERRYLLTQVLVNDLMREEEAKVVRRTLTISAILAFPLLCVIQFKFPWQTTLTIVLLYAIPAIVLFLLFAGRPQCAFYIRRQQRLDEFTPAVKPYTSF